ncbi:hypothetical protein DAPPUDRAFT_105106 [Daphnia pulex]|uniref:Replication protein A OB domain-containing protein n=1 Tax=Daphnia pulex TaxID=6669 RepID=E9GPH3_DAPPU|nr:hypothetical protein DAPPUDRAFT_105106 [Daphnia pulex]|eukprot:EFX78638.1 hypothetical protein DAPPUDRAFT_105106 [Daphnia pulex]
MSKARGPIPSTFTNRNIPLVKLNEISTYSQKIRFIGRVVYVSPLIRNLTGKKTTMLRMVLKDETKEIFGICYAKMANDWAKDLYMDAVYEFQLIQSSGTDFKIVSEYNEQLRINFNFDAKKIRNLNPAINIPDMEYTKLASVWEDGSQQTFLNIIGQLVSCLDPVGPDPEAGYDNIQQDYVIKDATKEVAMTIKGDMLFKKLKFFQSRTSKEPVIIRITRANPISNDEGEFLFVDQQESNVEVLLQTSTLYKTFTGDGDSSQNSLVEKRKMEGANIEEPENKKKMCE